MAVSFDFINFFSKKLASSTKLKFRIESAAPIGSGGK
jgi:hypothetical protein